MRNSILLAAALLLAVFGMAPPSLAEDAYVEGSVIVTFKPNATATDAQATLGRKSLGFTRRFGWLSGKRKREMGLIRHKTKTTAELIASLKDDPSVESVEPDYIRHVKAVPNDTRFTDMWALRNTGQTVNGDVGTAGDDTKFIEAWAMARQTSTEIVVGVIDTGADFVHPDLAANMWVNPAETAGNNTDDDANGYKDDINGYDFVQNLSHPEDSGYHGTHVCGTIAAVGNNQQGVIGIDYHTKIMALKVSSDGDTISTSAVISALQYAALMKGRGVNIVALNASYGGGSSSNAERTAIQAAGDAGIIFVAAAGNETANNDTTPSYPASYRLSNMIVVAASDQNDKLASFSNYGATKVDIAAPGVGILSTKPVGLQVQVGDKTYASSFMTHSGITGGISGTIYNCGIGNPADFPPAVRGNIALISRGTLFFSEKVTNAMNAGAAAAIIYNNVSGAFLGDLQNPGDWIPAISISQADGLAIINAGVPTAGQITAIPNYQYLDGTSMATPHVTAAVAFAARNFPSDTVSQRIHRILDNAEVKPAFQGKVATNGRLNLLKIVDSNANGVPDWLESTSPTAPTITTPLALPGGLINTPYSQTLTATGGLSPYTWTVVGGALPAGFSLSSDGVITGSPTVASVSSFAVEATDSVGASNGKLLSLTIAATPVTFTTAAQLPNARVAASYFASLEAAGGNSPYSWSVSAGQLPSGISLSAEGSLTGAPTAAVTAQFTLKVTDAGNLTAEQEFTLTVDPLPVAISTGPSLAPGVVNVAYNKALAASGGVPPYAWSLVSGTLPDGLALDPAGTLAGTPGAAGSFNFTLQVQDSGSRVKSQAFTVAIEPVPLVITAPSSLVPGVKGVAYSQTLTATGGFSPFHWAISSGTLPAGLKLNATTGVISGTPAVAGLYLFTAAVTDGLNLSQSEAMQLSVTATYVKPVLDPVTLGPTTVGVPFSYKVTASNYPRSFAITGLPPGIVYSTATGLISGRPTVGGVYTVTVKAVNPAGVSAPVTAVFGVSALDPHIVGSFTGLVDRDATINGGLGSRLLLTTASTGYFTAKVVTGVTVKSIVGYLLPSAPQVNVTLGGSLLALTLDTASNSLSGTYGTAAVTAFRQTWNATANKASSRAGYYTAGLDLADAADQGAAAIPQGTGYAYFTVTTAGTLTFIGRVADGSVFTSATMVGAHGEIPVYSPLYANLGSLAGTLTLTDNGATPLTDNVISGPLTWKKPATKVRAYPAAFGPVNLSVYGKYLAARSTGLTVLGLPDPGLNNLTFSDGGITASSVNPDVDGFTYTAAHTVVLPLSGSTANAGRATLVINRSTGLVTGTFTLKETAPLLTRVVAYQGFVIRSETGGTKAAGYFLLPQIPVKPQTLTTSPILSGRMTIEAQPAAGP